jgi:uncharacterized protein (DUF2235 family)
LVGGAFGDGLFRKIKNGYTFIAHTYDDGDQIFVFGFSRGAYTVRCLAGMIAISGLPQSDRFTNQTTDDAFRAYRDKVNRATLLNKFARDYGSRDVKIELVGVWDTVGSLGIPGPDVFGINEKIYGFLDTTLHPDVQAGYHAISIDEVRPVTGLVDARLYGGKKT